MVEPRILQLGRAQRRGIPCQRRATGGDLSLQRVVRHLQRLCTLHSGVAILAKAIALYTSGLQGGRGRRQLGARGVEGLLRLVELLLNQEEEEDEDRDEEEEDKDKDKAEEEKEGKDEEEEEEEEEE
jgi:hypothetical protein